MNEEEKVLINAQDMLDGINMLAKDAGSSRKNHAYWKGLRDAYKVVMKCVSEEVSRNGSDETGRPKTESDIRHTVKPLDSAPVEN